MKYDPEIPIAVFLGPSLKTCTARSVLTANYYPPVRLGDIYRLLATGVRTIAVIDGLFHESTPVWQRELVAALEMGIRVIGGCSMGALRAAEVAPYGMIGVGTIFEWYRDGVIDGDDEVALLHGDESSGYKLISEPLVNIRFSLQRAVEAGLLDNVSRDLLVDESKREFFGDRSWHALFRSTAFKGLRVQMQRSLEAFVREQKLNLKRDDALAVLAHCARDEVVTTVSPPPHWSYWGQRRPFIQCALTPDGDLVSGEQILISFTHDEELAPTAAADSHRRFFLLAWMKSKNIGPEASYRHSFCSQWYETRCPGNRENWLTSNGITAAELEAELDDRAAIAWLETKHPNTFGLNFEAYERCLKALVAALSQDPSVRNNLRSEAMAGCYLSAWARDHGVQMPAEEVEAFLLAWENSEGIHSRSAWLKLVGLDERDYLYVWGERALGNWMIEQGPAFFGYPNWSVETAILRQLQLEGRAAAIAQQIATGSNPAVMSEVKS
jgi:hypothetical protein